MAKIRRSNPRVLRSVAEVTQQFVVRQHAFNTVIDALRDNLEPGCCQHILVLGTRGQGKTTLLARVASELRTSDEFSSKMLPVRFPEESLEIFSATDFWLETLFQLTRECESLDSDLTSELRKVRSGLRHRWNEQGTEGQALAAIIKAADRLGRELVLMVENMQSLSDAVDEDFGWKLRFVMQMEPQIVLVGTATSRFKQLDDIRHPFFEIFRVVNLQPLSGENAKRCSAT